MSLTSIDTEQIILNAIRTLGRCNQGQIVKFVVLSQSNVAKILIKLEKRGIVKSVLTGNGHEKAYSISQEPVNTPVHQPGIILPPQPRDITQRNNYSAPTNPTPVSYQIPNSYSANNYPRQNLAPLVIYSDRPFQGKYVIDGYTIDAYTGSWITLGHYE